MSSIDALHAATRVALLLVCAASCGDADGGTSAAANSAAHNAQGATKEGPGDLRPDAAAFEHLLPLPNAPHHLVTPTYDGSGQTVEPTVLFFPEAWRGHRYWMAVSPYPYSNAHYENPSILVSEDGLSWAVPDGLKNPLVEPDQGALADATIVHDDASDELWVYYLEEVREAGVHWQLLRRMSSPDGVHWSPWTQLLDGHPYPLESPTIVKKGHEFLLWTVDIAPEGCSATTSHVLERSSADGIHWTGPAEAGLTVPGYVVWHLNVTQIGSTGRLLAAVTAFREGQSCHSPELFLAYTEGDRWVTVPQPLLSPSQAPAWDDRNIYRSSFVYDDELERLRVWYSAQNTATNAWHVGYTEGKLVLPT